MGYYGYYYDWTYILVLIGAVICMIASARVKTTYARYATIRSKSNMTGAEVAERILHQNGIYDVEINHVNGNLTDHYDPSRKVLNLSDAVYGSVSVAAVGVAAHECGHAIQHFVGYKPLSIRSSLVPAANIGSTLSWPLIIIGLIFSNGSSNMFIQAGIIMFSLAVLFQLVTLPVEFDASARALKQLSGLGILDSKELKGSRAVLRAAALTYVASAAAAILQLLRLVLLFGGRRRD